MVGLYFVNWGLWKVKFGHHFSFTGRLKAFFANKQILCDKKVRLAVRLRFFDHVITPVALFASGHRTIRMSDLYTRAMFGGMERTLA